MFRSYSLRPTVYSLQSTVAGLSFDLVGEVEVGEFAGEFVGLAVAGLGGGQLAARRALCASADRGAPYFASAVRRRFETTDIRRSARMTAVSAAGG